MYGGSEKRTLSIAIIGAMEEEIAGLKAQIEGISMTRIANGIFYTGRLQGKEVVLLQSGIGKANAALTTALLIERFNPELVINTGSAGGLDPALRVGDVVVATELTYSDVDGTAFGYTYGQVPQMPASYPVEPALLDFATKTLAATKIEGQIVTGLITTADSFIYQAERAHFIRSQFPKAKVTDMEGTAVVQTAYQFGIPFLAVRSLSDLAGAEAAGTFDSNLDLAAANSAAVVVALVAAYDRDKL